MNTQQTETAWRVADDANRIRIAGMTNLYPGDIVKITEHGAPQLVVRSSASGAKIIPLFSNAKAKEVEFGSGRKATFDETPASQTISQNLPDEFVLERAGESYVNEFLSTKRGAAAGDSVNNETCGTGEPINMSNKPLARGGLAAEAIRARKVGRPSNAERAARAAEAAPEPESERPQFEAGVPETKPVAKAVKVPKKKEVVRAVEPDAEPGTAKASTKGGLGSLFGFSVTSVIRALGKAGVTDKAQVTAILKARGIDANDGTVRVNLRQVALDTMAAAPLTKEQINELKAGA